MPKKFAEANIEFTFGDSWVVEKYDDHVDTRPFVGAVDHRKAVDFVGWNGGVAILIEIKDFRGFRIDNKPKLNATLATIVAQKVHDTLAGLVLTHRRTPATTLWRDALKACRTGDGDVRVILWLEDDALFRPNLRGGKSAAAIFMRALKRAMKWFPGQVLVVNRGFNVGGLPDVTAKDLSGAGGHGGAKK